MRNGTDRDAPKPVEPPTGPLEIYSYDPKSGRATLVEACGEDIARGEKVLRRLEGPACRARGGVVIGVKYGTAPTLIASMKAAVMTAYITAKTASPRTPEPVKARAAVERIEDESPTAPIHTDVEPAAPSTTDHDEEPMTTQADLCGRCKKHLAAGITPTTPKGTEAWCAHCRRIESARRNGNRIGGDRVSQSAKAAKKPTRKLAPKAAAVEASQSADPMAPLRAALDALVSRGGVDEERVREIARTIVREELRALLVRPS